MAGGTGSRLFPTTFGISKQLLPIYDKPMIYYPISLMMLTEIRDILLIVNEEHQHSFFRTLGDGSGFGLNITYAVQPRPEGLAQAFTIGECFIGTDEVCLALGDNLFWGTGFSNILIRASEKLDGATVFAYQVNNPSDFGIVEIDSDGSTISIEEKPSLPKSNLAVTGLYFYDNDVISIAKNISPSPRGELEITSINQEYLGRGRLSVECLGRGFAWLDTGTHENLLEASLFVETIEKRQGFKIACLEEIGLRKGWLDENDVMKASLQYLGSSYGKYLADLVNRSL